MSSNLSHKISLVKALQTLTVKPPTWNAKKDSVMAWLLFTSKLKEDRQEKIQGRKKKKLS